MENCFNCQWYEVLEVDGRKYPHCNEPSGWHSDHARYCPDVACEDWEEKEDE